MQARAQNAQTIHVSSLHQACPWLSPDRILQDEQEDVEGRMGGVANSGTIPSGEGAVPIRTGCWYAWAERSKCGWSVLPSSLICAVDFVPFKCEVLSFPWNAWLASLDGIPHHLDADRRTGHFKMADYRSNEDATTASDNETSTTAAGATMIAFSVIVVACRFYMRLKLKSGLKWDDWFILISLLSLITAGVLVVAGTFGCFLFFPNA